METTFVKFGKVNVGFEKSTLAFVSLKKTDFNEF
jgi:hypothetical protein